MKLYRGTSTLELFKPAPLAWVSSVARARELLKSCDFPDGELRRLADEHLPFLPPHASDEMLLDRLAQALVRGDLVLVEHDAPVPLGRVSARFGAGSEHGPIEPIVPLREPTWVACSVVHESGATYPGLRLNVALPDGELRTITLDARSSFRIEDIDGSGTCRVRASRDGLVLTPERKAAAGPPITRRADDIVTRSDKTDSLSLRTGLEHRIVVTDVPLSWLELSVVHETGGHFGGAKLEVLLADGTKREVELDAAGHLRLDDIPAGECRLSPVAGWRLSPDELRAPSTEPVEAVSDADVFVLRDASEPLTLPAGQARRLVVRRPALNPTRAFAGAAFSHDSAFPTPGAASMLQLLSELVDAERDAGRPPRLGLFGHCDPSGDDDYNKKLSDRRARAILALATGDADLFDEVGEADDWGSDAYQAMLRALGNDPGPIDGKIGPMTRAAIAGFRAEYGDDLYFDSSVRPTKRRHDLVPEGDSLDGPTKAAIRDAYHAYMCLDIAPEVFVGPKTSGCSEFNIVVPDRPGRNRRVTLAIYGDDAPADDEFPCTEGDASACALDERGQLRCRFYREHIEDPGEHPREFSFWDPLWLRASSSRAHLSMLTTVGDTDDATLVVYRLGETQGSDGRLAEVQASVRSGVVFGPWEHDERIDPFNVLDWFEGRGRSPHGWASGARFVPPTFDAHADGEHGEGGPPGFRTRAARVSGHDGPIVVVTSHGKVQFFASAEALLDADAEGRYVAVHLARTRYDREGDQ